MNLKKALTQRLSQPIVACCVPLGVQHATNNQIRATSDATKVQQTPRNPIETGFLSATSSATTVQQTVLHSSKKTSPFVALKLRVAGDVAAQLRPDQLADKSVTWRLTFADPACKITHYVCSPPTTRAEVFARFANEGLLSCQPDQSCRCCGWRVGQALQGSPVYCANPKLRRLLKPVYFENHPARIPPADAGATCSHHTTSHAQSP